MHTTGDLRSHAWYGVLQAGLRSLDRVDRDVREATGLPLAWFEALVALEREGGRRRMGDLADELLLSRGGATRLIARMEEAGLVERDVPADDRRATYAVVTPAGRAAAEQAAPLHEAAVHTHFGAAISDEDAQVLRRVCARVLEHGSASCGWLRRDAESF